MSDKKPTEVDPKIIKQSAQPLTQIAISSEDTANVNNFIKHFNMKPTEELTEAVRVVTEAFESGEITLEKQEQIKRALIFFLAQTDHELIQNDLFEPLRAQITALCDYIDFEDYMVENIESDDGE